MNKKLNPALLKIVNRLRDGNYHHGKTLGETCKLTPSGVWRIVQKLKQYGVALESLQAKGYRLPEPLILLEKNKIKAQLKQLAFSTKTDISAKLQIELFESIPSTNTYLKTKPAKLTVCLAEQQTQGRGRLNREWYSPFAQNIYLSLLYSFEKEVSELAGLSLVTSLAVLKALHSLGVDEQVFVKWPNDVYYDNKKLAGSLIEIQPEGPGVFQVIIGIGLNVNMVEDNHSVSQPWISLRKILGTYVDRNILCARLLHYLLLNLEQFKTEGFAPFAQAWMRSDCLNHKTVTIKNVNEKIQGYVMGINDQGHLLLKLANGNIRAFSAGETSILR